MYPLMSLVEADATPVIERSSLRCPRHEVGTQSGKVQTVRAREHVIEHINECTVAKVTEDTWPFEKLVLELLMNILETCLRHLVDVDLSLTYHRQLTTNSTVPNFDCDQQQVNHHIIL